MEGKGKACRALAKQRRLFLQTETDFGSGATYVAASRDMFDIVLGATARRDVAEVQLFVEDLNLRACR